MPTRRTPIKRAQRSRVTPAAVQAFIAEDDDALRELLGLKPWEISPLKAVGQCPFASSSMGARSWPRAQMLREQLEAAAETEVV